MHKKNIAAFLFIVLLFAVPIGGAWWLFSHPDRWPLKTVNHGVLIQPPLASDGLFSPADTKTWHDHWVLLYVNPTGACPQTCQQSLYYLRQVRLALGKNQDKVLRAYASPNVNGTEALFANAFAGTQALTVSMPALQRFAKGQDFSAELQTKGQLLLIDPTGWVMMRYPVDFTAKHVLDDLNRLLQVN